MDELNHYVKMLHKISNKGYELFVISRIFHLLDDSEIELTTQQLVRTEKGRFLLDLYFPQFKLAIEVDVGFHEKQIDADRYREMAIIERRNIFFQRIEVKDKSLAEIKIQINGVIDKIKSEKIRQKSSNKFIPFVFGRKYDVEFWLKKGKLSVADDARFRTHVDVAKLFGKNYKGHQRALFNYDDKYSVWFPKIYPNGDWNNSLSPDGKKIEMRRKDGGRYGNQTSNENVHQSGKAENFYVFAHHQDEFGAIYYKFTGVFKVQGLGDGDADFHLIFNSMNFDGKGRVNPV